MLETVRARLTLWYVSLLAAILLGVLVMTYVLLARAMYARVDDGLEIFIQIVGTSLANDLAEGQSVDDAARSTASELASPSAEISPVGGSGTTMSSSRPASPNNRPRPS